MTPPNLSGPIFLCADIRRIEAAAQEATPSLLERAGCAAADLVCQRIPNSGAHILVLAGPGHNGADAFVAARRLRERFFRVTVVCAADLSSLPAQARDAAQRFLQTHGEVLTTIPPATRWDLAIDGLFGIGLKRAPEGIDAHHIAQLNALTCPVLALDVPSGLNADTGVMLGTAVRATYTLSFIAHKPGLLTRDGPDCCGEVHIASLGLDDSVMRAAHAWIASPTLFDTVLKPRPQHFHKGLAGSVGVLGGDAGMTGAALIAARAALRLGAGRVYVGLLDSHAPSVDLVTPELMLRSADQLFACDLDALIVGPGMGDRAQAETLLIAALSSEIALVLDADALNLIAARSDLMTLCAERRAATLITPHPAEAARLLNVTTASIQADRVSAARSLSERLRSHVVLKGNGSILVATDGHWFINCSGNAGLASAGTGDALAGMLGALMAQGLVAEAAMVLGTHLHGCAADMLVEAGAGPIGLTATELAAPARQRWNAWTQGTAR